MNINPCDGGNMGYGSNAWMTTSAVGTNADRFAKDFVDPAVWSSQAGYITIVRHQQNGVCDMFKTWELTDKDKSMLDYFTDLSPGRIYATGDGSQSDTHINAYLPSSFEGSNTDPIFGVPDGGLVFNWWYSNNGARIANPAGYKNPYALPGTGENNDDVHGLGNEFGANTEGGEGSDSYWHDAAELSGDCHGGSCKVVGTDRGGSMPSGPCWGSYAIYVSTSANAFVCQ